jgi:hypothetical protein
VDKDKAIIVDIDGTISHKTDRDIYDYQRAIDDTPDKIVLEVIRALWQLKYKIVIVTGRSDDCAEVTREWLRIYCPPYFKLFMRKAGDNRQDAVVKREIYETHIEPNFDILCVFDDRNQVVDMWREIGLKCFQVQPGDF